MTSLQEAQEVSQIDLGHIQQKMHMQLFQLEVPTANLIYPTSTCISQLYLLYFYFLLQSLFYFHFILRLHAF